MKIRLVGTHFFSPMRMDGKTDRQAKPQNVLYYRQNSGNKSKVQTLQL